jgi:uncharacterized SAM-binding protein YcdF (DUF218 family)
MQSDVIVVLAGGITDDGMLPVVVKKRIDLAKKLFDAGLAKKILMSGRWSVYRESHLPPRTEATAMAEYAQQLGVSPSAILKEEQSNTTLKNAYFVKKLFLQPNQWRRLVVVTSDFHLPRTKYIFSTLLGAEYQIAYRAAKTNYLPLKKLYLWFFEKVNLGVAWLTRVLEPKLFLD